MIDLQADLDAVFYAPDGDFVVQAVLRRHGEPDAPFTAQVFEGQGDQLDDRFSSVMKTLRYPTQRQLEDGDEIVIGLDRYRLGLPRLVADGHESEAPLTPIPA